MAASQVATTAVVAAAGTLSAFIVSRGIKVEVPEDSIVTGFTGLIEFLVTSTWAFTGTCGLATFLSMKPWDPQPLRAMRDQLYIHFFVPFATLYLALLLSNNLTVSNHDESDLKPVQRIGAALVPYNALVAVAMLATGFCSLEGSRVFQDDFVAISITSAALAAVLRFVWDFAPAAVAISSILYLFWTVTLWFAVQHFHTPVRAPLAAKVEQDGAAPTARDMGLQGLQSDDEGEASGVMASTPKQKTRKTKTAVAALTSEDEGDDDDDDDDGDLRTIRLPRSNVRSIEQEDDKPVIQALRRNDIALPRRRRSRAPKPLSPQQRNPRELQQQQRENDEMVDEVVTTEDDDEEEVEGEYATPRAPGFERSPIDEEKIPKDLRIKDVGPKSPGAGLASRRLRNRRSISYKY